MPMHDWTRVPAGTYHDFHCIWLGEIRNRLNDGLLPDGHLARVEAVLGGTTGDGVVLREAGVPPSNGRGDGVALLTAPPQVRFSESIDADVYAGLSRHIVIRHASGDHVVALIELLSPGNKSSEFRFDAFLDVAQNALAQGVHLLVIDPFPPTARDPDGVHAALWGRLGGHFTPPPDKPLTLAAYASGSERTSSFVEPIAVGDALIDMPLFLTPSHYVNVPLEATYAAMYRVMPRRDRLALEAP